MQVTVVIPVYNAEKYVSHAIDSALEEEEVAQIILIDDGSTDQSLAICKDYAQRKDRIQLLCHQGGANRGVSASRNLGIQHAATPFIAFLDADDQYVKGCFKQAAKVFHAHPEAHGVYGHIGVIYYDPDFKDQHLKRMPREITGMHQYTKPEELLRMLLLGDQGHISVDSLVLRREILTRDYLFDETFRQRQDTDFMYRLAGSFRLYSPEKQTIVALRGVHASNRVFNTDEAQYYAALLLEKCIAHDFYLCNNRQVVNSVIYRYLKYANKDSMKPIPSQITRRLAFILYLLFHPRVAWLWLRSS